MSLTKWCDQRTRNAVTDNYGCHTQHPGVLSSIREVPENRLWKDFFSYSILFFYIKYSIIEMPFNISNGNHYVY